MSSLARVIAFGLVLALADAAFASVRGPIPALAAAGVGAALAFIVFVLSWPRPWIAVAFAMLMLAGSFAVGTLWGVGSGHALTGVAPVDAAAIVFALAIVAAGFAAAVALPSSVVRVVVSALAIYGLVATIASVQHGGIAATFAAGPLAWTRGSYAAAEVFLPLAALAMLVYGVVQLARRRGAKGAAALVLATAFVAATQLGAFAAGAAGLPTIVDFERASLASHGLASGTLAAAAGPSTNVAMTSSLLGNPAAPVAAPVDGEGGGGPETGALFVPKGSTDVPAEIGATAARIAAGPQHALDVAAALSDDLYPGALAGSVGALRGGSANSVDKALFLRDLIRAGSPSAEMVFARCTLADADADALVAQARAPRAHPKIGLQLARDGAAGPVTAGASAIIARWAQTWKALVAQTQDDGRKLGVELQTAGLTIPAGQLAPDRLRALAAAHVWLRLRVDGNWVDLDPTIEPAALGKTRCAAQAQSAALPDDLYDVLGVRVTREVFAGGAPQRATIFDRTIRTVDIGGRDVSFMFAEPAGMESALAAPPAPAPATQVFTPLLRVGNESLGGTAIVLPDLTAVSVGKTISSGLGAVAGLLDSGPASPTPAATVAPDVPAISGVWMELSVTAPGSETTFVQSPIFDRIGYAARVVHALPATLVSQPDTDSYLALQTVWNIAVSAGHVASGAGPATAPPGANLPALSSALARMNAAYFQLRRALMDEAHGGSVGVVAAQPGISLLALTQSGGLMIDIASDAALPLAADEARPAWAAAAVLAERQLIAGFVAAKSDAPAPADNDALAAFDRAAAAGTRIVAFHPSDPMPAQSVIIPDQARARISTHLARGASILAMAPDAPAAGGPPYAYWIVDPARGTLRDENVFGRHVELGEQTPPTQAAVQRQPLWRRLGLRACNIIASAFFTVAMDSSKAEGKAFSDVIANVEKAQDTTQGCGGP